MLIAGIIGFSLSGLTKEGEVDEVGRIDHAEVKPQAAPIKAAKETTETITLELKNMDVVEVIKLLASKSGLDVVISNNVRGRITLFLDEVPVWDAMQIVFETVDLAYVERENIFRIITGREYEQEFGRKFHDKRKVKVIKLNNTKADDMSRELRSLKSRIGNIIPDTRTNALILLDTPDSIVIMENMILELDVPVETMIYPLKYAPAKSLEEVLKKMLSKRGALHVDDYTNKIIITDSPNVIRKVNLIIEEYDRPTVLQTKIYTLNYAKYDKVEEKIKTMLTKDIGIIKSDERTNKLVVTDLPEKIIEIDRLIAAYDEPTTQVLIEAKIVQVNLNDQFSMGINWQLILNKVWVDRIFGTDTIDMTLSSVFSTLSEMGRSDTDPFDGPTRSKYPGGRALVTGTLKEGHDFDSIIDALKTVGNTDLLSSPRITAINNQKAVLKVATREAFVTNTVVQSTSTSTTAENVTFVDVGVILTVTPTINDDDFITIEIKPEISHVSDTLITSQGNTIPIVATQEAETIVMVKSGTTILMGGLIEDRHLKTTRKIPFIGSIPLLGIPFRSETSTIRKNELVIFLTPHIVTGDIDLNTPSPKMLKYLEKIAAEEKQAAEEAEFEEKPLILKPNPVVEIEVEEVEQNYTHR